MVAVCMCNCLHFDVEFLYRHNVLIFCLSPLLSIECVICLLTSLTPTWTIMRTVNIYWTNISNTLTLDAELHQTQNNHNNNGLDCILSYYRHADALYELTESPIRYICWACIRAGKILRNSSCPALTSIWIVRWTTALTNCNGVCVGARTNKTSL